MIDLVEKVARDWNISEQMARGIIRNVLDAIAEPSEAMQLAGHNVRNDPVTGMPTSCGTDEIYRAMIAALRKEV